MPITLKAARVNRGLSQDEAGKIIGVSKNTISNWEIGRSFPDAIQILRIQDAYKVKYDDLVFLPSDNALSVNCTTDELLAPIPTGGDGKEET